MTSTLVTLDSGTAKDTHATNVWCGECYHYHPLDAHDKTGTKCHVCNPVLNFIPDSDMKWTKTNTGDAYWTYEGLDPKQFNLVPQTAWKGIPNFTLIRELRGKKFTYEESQELIETVWPALDKKYVAKFKERAIEEHEWGNNLKP